MLGCWASHACKGGKAWTRRKSRATGGVFEGVVRSEDRGQLKVAVEGLESRSWEGEARKVSSFIGV